MRGEKLPYVLGEHVDMGGAPTGIRPVLYVLPRGTRYSRQNATSIDLFVTEIAMHSQLRVEVVAEKCPDPLPTPNGDVLALESRLLANTLSRASQVARWARVRDASALIVQQHLPSAAAIAARTTIPVILQKHNFVRAPRNNPIGGGLSRSRYLHQFRSLAGITFVSAAALRKFEADWPEVSLPRCVVPNGIDFPSWHPAETRDRTILAVGRAAPEKGLLETAKALRQLLPERPGWTGTIVASATSMFPQYLVELEAEVKASEGRVKLLTNQPFASVKALNETAAIAVIASRWDEPFGRTCLEAHAGGAAVVSSGTGGLSEISGDCARFLSEVCVPEITKALAELTLDDVGRVRMGDDGHRRVRSLFALQPIASKLDAFVCEVSAAANQPVKARQVAMTERSQSGAQFIPKSVTVCVTSCGRLDLLAETLRSFRTYNAGGNYLISEDSTDPTVIAAVAERYPEARVVSGPERLGLMRSIDRLYSHVETPYLFHIEDDWTFDGPVDWAAAISFLEARQDVAHLCVREFGEIKEKYRVRSDLVTRAGREFRIMHVNAHPEFFAWSSNPGLMAASTYRRYAPFAQLQHDQMSGRMKKDGLRQAFMLPGIARHIGQGRNVVDPTMPARPRSRPQKWLRSIKKRLYYAGVRKEPF